MSIKTQRTKIKDCEYSVTTMDGEKNLEGLGTLSKFLGGPLGRLLAASRATQESSELMAGAMREIGEHLGSEEFRQLVYTMLEGSTVKFNGRTATLIAGGNRDTFKDHFSAGTGALLALIWFALKENYSDFLDGFPGAAGLIQRLRATALSPKSPEVSTGESPA